MGHRQGFSTSQLFDADHDQHWSHIHVEDPYVHLGAGGSSVNESNSLFHPGDNLPIEEVHCASHWTSAPRTNVFPSSNQIVPPPPNHSDPSSTPDSLRPSVSLNPFVVHENHTHHASSSNFMVENSSAFDLSMGHGRGHYKRKSPITPTINERGSAGVYYCAGGSSSDVSSPLNFIHERLNEDVQHSRWEPVAVPSNYNSSVGESSLRNVRSRTSFDLDSDIFGAHRTPNYSQHASSSSRHPIDHSNTTDHPTPGPALPLSERNLIHLSASHGRTIVPDSSGLNHEANPFISGNGSNIHNVSAHIGGYPHDLGSSRNSVVSQSFHPAPAQATRAARSCFPQRANPTTNRVSVGSLRLGHAPLDEGLRFVAAESYSSRHQRPFSSVGWRNSDRSRSRLSAERYRSLSVDALSHDRLTPEGVVIVDRPTFHGSRSLFDQHRDLRLDVDNMTYEELLALGERIGSVSTGLSENQLLKCLEETVHSSPDQIQGEDRCVICLEEYQSNDEIGTVKACNHRYHIGCIKKWLSIKNLCPVCKAAALPDDMKEKEKEK